MNFRKHRYVRELFLEGLCESMVTLNSGW